MPGEAPHSLPTSLTPHKQKFAATADESQHPGFVLNYGFEKPFVLVGSNHDQPRCLSCERPVRQLEGINFYKCSVHFQFIRRTSGDVQGVTEEAAFTTGNDHAHFDTIHVKHELADEFASLSVRASPLIDEKLQEEVALSELDEQQPLVDEVRKEIEESKGRREERATAVADLEEYWRKTVEARGLEVLGATRAVETLTEQVHDAHDEDTISALQEDLDKQVDAKEEMEIKLQAERDASDTARQTAEERLREVDAEKEENKVRRRKIIAAKDEIKEIGKKLSHKFLQKIGALMGGLGDLLNRGKNSDILPGPVQQKFENKMGELDEDLNAIDQEEESIKAHAVEIEQQVEAIRQSSNNIVKQAEALVELTRRLDAIQESIIEKE